MKSPGSHGTRDPPFLGTSCHSSYDSIVWFVHRKEHPSVPSELTANPVQVDIGTPSPREPTTCGSLGVGEGGSDIVCVPCPRAWYEGFASVGGGRLTDSDLVPWTQAGRRRVPLTETYTLDVGTRARDT